MGYVVSGAVAVLKIKGGNGDERYVYSGLPVDPGVFEQKSIDHCIQVGLITKVDDPAEPPAAQAPAEPPAAQAPAKPPAAQAPAKQEPKK